MLRPLRVMRIFGGQGVPVAVVGAMLPVLAAMLECLASLVLVDLVAGRV